MKQFCVAICLIALAVNLFVLAKIVQRTAPQQIQPIENAPRLDYRPPVATPALKTCAIVVVEQPETRLGVQNRILNDHEFWYGELQNNGFIVRRYEPGDNEAASFVRNAEARGIDPPFVMSVNSSGTVTGCIQFPESVDEIRQLIR